MRISKTLLRILIYCVELILLNQDKISILFPGLVDKSSLHYHTFSMFFCYPVQVSLN